MFSHSTRRIFMFLVGILSLLFGGVLVGENFDFNQLIVLFISGLCGVMLIYNVNNQKQNENWFQILKGFLKNKTNALFVLILIVIIPFALKYLSGLSFGLLSAGGIIGVMYSLNYKIGKLKFKLKNILFLKNILIGLGWGGLVAIGAGSLVSNQVMFLTGFMMLQVFLGSIIRDFEDIENDKINGIRSLPVEFGVSNSIWIMHFINLLSLSILLLNFISFETQLVIIVLVIWRLVNLSLIKVKGVNNHLIQTFNLTTCYLFFIIILIQYYYGLYSKY